MNIKTKISNVRNENQNCNEWMNKIGVNNNVKKM